MSILHSIFVPDEVPIGEFESWSGKKTAVSVKFANIFAINGELFFDNVIRPIWEYGHIPLLTLEPWGSEDIAEEIAMGEHDDVLEDWSNNIQSYITDDSYSSQPRLYIRFAHEMNGNWYPWSGNPESYKRMYKRFHDMVMNHRAVNEDTVQFIWTVNCDDVGGHRMEDYYPNDEYVDWCGIDGYNFGSKRNWSSWRSPSNTFDAMLTRVRDVSGGKPIAIPETGSTAQKDGVMNNSVKNQWIRSLYDWADTRDIELLSWFNENKTTDWDEGKPQMDWAVYGYLREYDAYSNEVQKGRVIGSNGSGGGNRVISTTQFRGRTDSTNNGGSGTDDNTNDDTTDTTMSEHTLEIISDGGKVSYYFACTGPIDPYGLEGHDELNREEANVKGHCWNGTDEFGFDGAPMHFYIRNEGGYEHLTLKLDGEKVNPAHLKMNIIEVRSTDGTLASYGLSSSGKLIRRGEADDSDVIIDDGEARGEVIGWKDKYAYQGCLTGFWCNVDCDITINGETRTVKGNPPQGSFN